MTLTVDRKQPAAVVRAGRLVPTLFVVYLIFLVWAVLWKFGMPRADGAERVINLVPFAGNMPEELSFNVLVFVPFGFFTALLAPRWGPIRQVLVFLGSSVALETVQYIGGIGRSDVTDLILNTLGGIIGLVLFAVMSRLLAGRARRAWPAVAIAITLIELAVAVVALRYLYLGALPPSNLAPGG